MWKDDDRIMNNIESQERARFPVICPVCGKKDGHLYFHRYKEGNEQGGMWVWCGACCHSAHALYRVPEWWKNFDRIKFAKLTSTPFYLEKNKNSIDEWVNSLIFPNSLYGREEKIPSTGRCEYLKE